MTALRLYSLWYDFIYFGRYNISIYKIEIEILLLLCRYKTKKHISSLSMSGQEEQSNINHVEAQGESQLEIESAAAPALAPVEDNNGHDELSAIQNLMMAAVRRDILDHMYYYGLPLRQIPMSDVMGQDDAAAAASILSRSLYDRNPVKKVISDQARLQLTETKFTASMVAKMKINDACGIWQDDFEEGEPITILPCNHAFKQPAIMKWLQEEKAECPVCRKPLHSKEVNERQSLMFEYGGQAADDQVNAQYDMDDRNDRNDRDNRGQEPEPESDDYRNVVQVNNIASRLAHGVAGYVGQNHSQQSVSMPINRLLQSLRIMSSSIRRSHEPVRASMPSVGGAAAAPRSNYEPRDVRAVPVPAPDLAPLDAALPSNVNIYSIINNYYNNNNNNDDIINNNINIINNDFISNQEQNDIEEAIRRSLEN